MFRTSSPYFPTDLDNIIANSISTSENGQLDTIRSDNEIRVSFVTICSLKSPGPNGMTPLFFKHYWGIVSVDFYKVVKDFFHKGRMLREANHMFVVLIP